MKKKVLVVDDDKLVADTLSLIFQANGYESEARYTAADGLDRARTYGPELLLCDVSMPEETGLDLAEKMSHELPGTRLLMLTAYAGNAAHVDAQSARLGLPLKLLRKPCRPEDLLHEANILLKSA